jgi:hypothetical protein
MRRTTRARSRFENSIFPFLITKEINMIPRTEERPNTIGLKYRGFYEEGRAAAAGILPGHLIELLDTEDDVPRLPARVQEHSTAGAKGVIRVAIEDRLGGNPNSIIGKNINTVFDEDDIVPYITAVPGDVFLLRVATASGPWTIGTPLASAGDGTVEAVGGGTAIVEVEENIDFTDDDSGDEHLLRCRVI